MSKMLPFAGLPLALLFLVLGTGVFFGGGGTHVNAAGPCSASVSQDADEVQFLSLLNSYRATYGLVPLTLSATLSRAADWMANDMGTKAYFNHIDSLGRSPTMRAVDCGYPYPSVGENIAAGQDYASAQGVFDAWRNSPGHNANMLQAAFRQVGIGRVTVPGSYYSTYWVTDFSIYNVAEPAAKATLFSPAPGTTLIGPEVTFTWNANGSFPPWGFQLGTSPGLGDLVSQNFTTPSALITNLPVNGVPIYARLWTMVSGVWLFTDYTYTAHTTIVIPNVSKATMNIPAPGSVLPAGSVIFSWSANGTTEIWGLQIGHELGTGDYHQFNHQATTATVTTIPSGGQVVFVRLWSWVAGAWAFEDTTYTGAPSGQCLPA